MDSNLKFWDRFAGLYTPLQEKSNREIYDQVCSLCRPYISEDSRVLELGCGTGQFTFPLCDGAASWEATDFSSGMVEEGRKRSRGKARFSVRDATALDFPEGSFDLVLMANTLHIMPEPEKALAEIGRVLVPGGVLLAPTFIYEGKRNKPRLWIMEKAGFRTFHKWKRRELEQFVEDRGFRVQESQVIQGRLLPELFLAARKK